MKKTYFIIGIFSLLFFESCKKYPDDPFFSFVTVKNRLDGSWILQNVTIDGIDSTEQFKVYGCGCSMNIANEMDEGVIFSKECDQISKTICGSSKEWGLDNKKNLGMAGYLVYPHPIELSPSPHVKYLTHYILKLYKGVLKFKVTHPDNGKEYIFEYKAKS